MNKVPNLVHIDLPVAAFSACWVVRPDMSTAEFTVVADAVIVDAEVRSALVRLWDRRARLTPFELATLEAIIGD